MHYLFSLTLHLEIKITKRKGSTSGPNYTHKIKYSELSVENKLLIYKTILKPNWIYGIALWGAASNSNIEILQKYQHKVLRAIVNAPWYISDSLTCRLKGTKN